MIVAVEFIDYGAQGEYGFFGKKVAKLDTIGMTDDIRKMEVAAMVRLLGDHVFPVEVYQV